jgi:two-component system, LuxR family, response regulator FixJ
MGPGAMKDWPSLPLAKSVVLVIDDDPAVCSSLKFSLEVEGFVVRIYPGAYELLNEIDLPSKSCLLIDYHMPVMNGLELLERLRDRGITLPAMVITSQPSRRLRERIAAAGVPLVEKPFLGSVLVDQVRDAFRAYVGTSPDAASGPDIAS